MRSRFSDGVQFESASVGQLAPRIVGRLPGGACVEETWSSRRRVSLWLSGEIDLYDKHALVDLMASAVMAGAREVIVETGGLSFIDMTGLRAFNRIRVFLEKAGGALEVRSLRPALATAWTALVDSTPLARPATALGIPEAARPAAGAMLQSCQ